MGAPASSSEEKARPTERNPLVRAVLCVGGATVGLLAATGYADGDVPLPDAAEAWAWPSALCASLLAGFLALRHARQAPVAGGARRLARILGVLCLAVLVAAYRHRPNGLGLFSHAVLAGTLTGIGIGLALALAAPRLARAVPWLAVPAIGSGALVAGLGVPGPTFFVGLAFGLFAPAALCTLVAARVESRPPR